MRVTVFGSGYVGLVQAAVLASVGHRVVCVDKDAERINRLRHGEIPLFEPGVDGLVAQGLRQGLLSFTTDGGAGVRHGDVIFIAVGTPPAEDGSADVGHVLAVARTVGEHMEAYRIVVVKSTVPVGTADAVRATVSDALRKRDAQIDFDVVANPEFLKEGSAVADALKPDRIIIGTNSRRAATALRRLYAPFNRNRDRIIQMDVRSAELTKYAANCMLATKISFMNEMANLAERLGADIEQVRQGIGSDRRIGFDFIYPGCGFGGSCFPKDLRALIATARQVGYAPALLESVQSVNLRQKSKLFDRVAALLGDGLHHAVIAVWGLAFKPGTDDMREAPSRALIDALLDRGAAVRGYDPKAGSTARSLYGDRAAFTVCDTKEGALNGADLLVICTEWPEFRSPDFEAIRAALRRPVIVDGRNLYDPEYLRELGLTYYAIGRGASVVDNPARSPSGHRISGRLG